MYQTKPVKQTGYNTHIHPSVGKNNECDKLVLYDLHVEKMVVKHAVLQCGQGWFVLRPKKIKFNEECKWVYSGEELYVQSDGLKRENPQVNLLKVVKDDNDMTYKTYVKVEHKNVQIDKFKSEKMDTGVYLSHGIDTIINLNAEMVSEFIQGVYSVTRRGVNNSVTNFIEFIKDDLQQMWGEQQTNLFGANKNDMNNNNGPYSFFGGWLPMVDNWFEQEN